MRRLLPIAFIALALSSAQVYADGLRPFVSGSWQAILKEHRGRPLIVHFWGLTCGPCRVEMPAWGQLYASQKSMPLVLVNADLVQDSPDQSLQFLTQAGLVNAENWLFNDSFTQRLYYQVHPSWQGELPATALVGKDGKTEWINGTADMAKVRSWLANQKVTN